MIIKWYGFISDELKKKSLDEILTTSNKIDTPTLEPQAAETKQEADLVCFSGQTSDDFASSSDGTVILVADKVAALPDVTTDEPTILNDIIVVDDDEEEEDVYEEATNEEVRDENGNDQHVVDLTVEDNTVVHTEDVVPDQGAHTEDMVPDQGAHTEDVVPDEGAHTEDVGQEQEGAQGVQEVSQSATIATSDTPASPQRSVSCLPTTNIVNSPN